MTINFALILELFVAILLVTTCVYCYILNKRLTHLRADEQLMRQTIRDLCASIDNAEMAVDKLSKATAEREGILRSLINSADHTNDLLKTSQKESLDILGALRQQAAFSNEVLKQFKSEQQLHISTPVRAPSTAQFAEQNAFVSMPTETLSSIFAENDAETESHFEKYAAAIEIANLKLELNNNDFNTKTTVKNQEQAKPQQKRKPFSAPFSMFKRDVA